VTTIAFDGKNLVADGRATAGNLIVAKSSKKIFELTVAANGVEYRAVMAGAGSYQALVMAVKAMEDSENILDGCPGVLEPESFSGLLILEDGRVFALEDHLVPMPVEIPVAQGSGTEYALTSMRIGQDAIDAVLTACDMDVFSGGDLTAFDTHAWAFFDPLA